MSNIEQPEPQFTVPLWMTRRHRGGGQPDEFDRGRMAGKVIFVNAEGREVSREEHDHWGGR